MRSEVVGADFADGFFWTIFFRELGGRTEKSYPFLNPTRNPPVNPAPTESVERIVLIHAGGV